MPGCVLVLRGGEKPAALESDRRESRNFVRNLDRAEGNRDKHFSDEPVDYLLETLGRRDEYPSESFVLYVGGSSCAVESETLYKALLSLPERQRNVLREVHGFTASQRR